jgi:tetratricopeptide (TPR) repeat protein
VAEARARIDEIIGERMTIAEAEQFIQENTGRANRYMGPVFLRLGELYEAEGDLRSAEDIYEEVPDLFPNEPNLIERAQAHLARLEQQNQ